MLAPGSITLKDPNKSDNGQYTGPYHETVNAINGIGNALTSGDENNASILDGLGNSITGNVDFLAH